MTDPYEIRPERRPSPAPLVEKVRTEVDRWRVQLYTGASPTSRRLLEHWFLDEHQTEDGLPFQYFFAQREAIETLIYLYEVARSRTLADLAQRYASRPIPVEPQDFPRYVVKMATGSGKTKVMSLAIAWAYFHALREPDSPLATASLIVAPNLIVYERLRQDFESGQIFANDPVVPPEWRNDFDLQVCLREDPIPQHAPGVLALTNIQALYERRSTPTDNPVTAVLGPAPPARINAPDPLLVQLSRRGRVLVVNDEAHHLHDQIRAESGEPLVAIQTLRRLHQLARDNDSSRGVVAQLDFSATPRHQSGQLFAEIVSDYPLAEAIEDGIVKRPVIGELSGALEAVSDDASVRYRQRIGAGVAKWREFRDVLAPAGRKPLLFVMAEDTAAADDIARYLEMLPDLSGKVLTIHVKMRGKDRGEVVAADLEQARRWAREVDQDDNPYAAIVSVLMLREGWDVRNVSVILPLRAYTAKAQILPEQTLGRGLRRMTQPGSRVTEKLVVIEHEAFRHLWDQALDSEGLTVERRAADMVHPEATVIAVEPDRIPFDIEIPQLSRTLSRTASVLGTLRPEDVPKRHLPLDEELHSDTIDYIGRDLLTREVVDRATYPLPAVSDPTAMLAWYVNELQRDTRLTGQFHVLAPLVKEYIQHRVFGEPRQLNDPLVLQALARPPVQETILGALREAVDRVTLATTRATLQTKPIRLSTTRPFLWSGETASAEKSVFSAQPCDSGFEAQFAGFLDYCPDVAAFAKLAREVRFSLEYRVENGRLAYYYPDFVVRLHSGEHFVIETKGLADLDVPHKDRRATQWAVDATALSGVRWRYIRVDQEIFDQHVPRLRSLGSLVDLVYEIRRQQYLRDAPQPQKRSRAEILANMAKIRERMRGVTGVDEEISRMREDPRD
jgi:type III restriction enzyme